MNNAKLLPSLLLCATVLSGCGDSSPKEKAEKWVKYPVVCGHGLLDELRLGEFRYVRKGTSGVWYATDRAGVLYWCDRGFCRTSGARNDPRFKIPGSVCYGYKPPEAP